MSTASPFLNTCKSRHQCFCSCHNVTLENCDYVAIKTEVSHVGTVAPGASSASSMMTGQRNNDGMDLYHGQAWRTERQRDRVEVSTPTPEDGFFPCFRPL